MIFHPGWMSARHKQSFYVSRSALILNALMGNIEVPGGCVLGEGARALRPQGLEPSGRPGAGGHGAARGWCRRRAAAVGSGHRRWCTGRSPRWRPSSRTGSAPTSPTATTRSPALPDPEATQRAIEKLKLLVSIDVRYSEMGWFADVILPESTYLERANILCQMNGPVPVFAMRDQAIAPRFDSRPAWWIFREILHRMGIKQALDFETIEELWNYQLDGTGVTVAEMRETGIVGLAAAPKLIPRDELTLPDARRGRSRSRARSSSRRGLRACRRTSPRRRRPAISSRCCSRRRRRSRRVSRSTILSSTRERPNRCSGSTPTVPRRSGSPTATRSRSTAVAATAGYLPAKVTRWIHPEAVFMLHGYGATVPLATRALRPRRRRPAPAARQALRLRSRRRWLLR